MKFKTFLEMVNKSDIPAYLRKNDKMTTKDLEKERTKNRSHPETIKKINGTVQEEVLGESVFADKEQAQSVADKLKKKHDDGNYSVVADHGKHRVVHAYNSDSKVKKDIARLNEEQLDEVNQKTVALAKEIAKKHRNMTSDVSRGNVHIFNKHDDEAADRLVLSHTGTDKEGNDRFHLHRVHSSAEDSDHRNLTAAEVHKHAARHITGKTIAEEVEELDEKSEQSKRNKIMKNMMDASRGARHKLNNPVPDAEPEHKTARAHNVAIGRALRKEDTEQVEEGYYQKPASAYRRKGDEVGGGSSKNDVPFDGPYTKTPATTKDKSGAVHTAMSRAKHLAKQAMKNVKEEVVDEQAPVAPVPDKKYIKGTPEHTAYKATKKPINGMPTNVKEALKGDQHKIDKNKNGKIDAHDFKLLRKEEEQLDELSKGTLGSYIKKASNDLANKGAALGKKQADADEVDRYTNRHMPNQSDARETMRKAVGAGHDDINKVRSGAIKRNKNIGKAVDRLSKEEFENGELETMSKSYKQFVESLNEIKMSDLPSRKVSGSSYGAQYHDSEGDDEEEKPKAKPADAVKRGRGRPAGAKSGARQGGSAVKTKNGADYTGYKLHLPNKN
jgi:hypothetical protein